MNDKTQRRITLDTIGRRSRARAYSAMHVSKPFTGRIISDISAPVRSSHRTTLQPKTVAIAQSKPMQHDLVMAAAVHASKSIAEPRAVSYHPTTIKRQVSSTAISETIEAATVSDQQPESIIELVSTIQHRPYAANPLIAVAEPEPQEQSIGSTTSRLKKVKKAIFKKSSIMSLGAVLLMIGGSFALYASTRSNKLVTTQAKALSDKAVIAENTAEGSKPAFDPPTETPVPDSVVRTYSVAPDLPRYISIPKIKNGRSRVLPMGLDAEGLLKTPRNVWDTAWYDGSSKPGDKIGAALIMGHVSGPTNGGVFYNLYRVTDGDEINVTMGDGTVLTYTVVGKEEVPADSIEMTKYLISKDVDKPGLTIMTCAGEFNPKTQTYDKRLAVFAVRGK
jgi:sortase (surface protein transpeptidase)